MDGGQKENSSLFLIWADRSVDDLLDEALQATFPASDPVAIGGDWMQGRSRKTSRSKRR
jgi:hypothetical protein